LFLPSGCTSAITGSGHRTEAVRPLEPFSAVAVSGQLHLELELGPEQRVVIAGDDNIVPLIEAVVQGGELTVRSTQSYRSDEAVMVRVVVPRLDNLALSGATDAHLRQLAGPELEVHVSGASEVTLEGKVDRLVLELSGAADLDAARLEAQSVTVRASGAGAVKVHARESLDVTASGAVSVEVSGRPARVTEKVSGVAGVRRVGE
jgi:hypothetical protein